jgi:hypothetical protein
MQAEIELIQKALREDSGILFKVPIAFTILRTPTASLFGVLFKLAEDIQLLFGFGGTYPSQTRLFDEHYCI